MLLVTPQPDAALAVARQHGMTAQVIGIITAQRGLRLTARGIFEAEEQVLRYDA